MSKEETAEERQERIDFVRERAYVRFDEMVRDTDGMVSTTRQQIMRDLDNKQISDLQKQIDGELDVSRTGFIKKQIDAIRKGDRSYDGHKLSAFVSRSLAFLAVQESEQLYFVVKAYEASKVHSDVQTPEAQDGTISNNATAGPVISTV